MRGILTGIGGIMTGFSGIMTGIGRIMTEPSSWRNSSYIDPVSTYGPLVQGVVAHADGIARAGASPHLGCTGFTGCYKLKDLYRM